MLKERSAGEDQRTAPLKARNAENEHFEEKSWSIKMKGLTRRQTGPGVVFLLCVVSMVSHMRQEKLKFTFMNLGSSFEVGHGNEHNSLTHLTYQETTQLVADRLRSSTPSLGWRSSAASRNPEWSPPPERTNGYLLVRCNGGLNQQRGAICNAVLAARIMNATLVLPALDTNSFWHDKSGFSGIYDVRHFITSLANDVKVVTTLPLVGVVYKQHRRIKPFQLRPPRNALPNWYETVALAKMKEHGAILLSPFSHRLAEELDNLDYQRLRCRVNYHALRFREDVMSLSSKIVARLRAEGQFLAIHLRFEMDMLAFAGCTDIFTVAEQAMLVKYRMENFAEKTLHYTDRRLIGKCPLTPEEVGLILRALGYDNSTHIYIAAGDIFGGERFMDPLRKFFPRLKTRKTVATADELNRISTEGLLGPAVDYMVCLLSDIFMPTFEGPSNFANNLLGHRLYNGFHKSIIPDRRALAPIFMKMEEGSLDQGEFKERVKAAMRTTLVAGPHTRVEPESFYTNPWPECFCKPHAARKSYQCPGPI
uniref:O-fucosyltransferase family protein n=1 Tax=Physcomitrium patens TaxID=3218 RepID=A0A7I4EHB8_PHYPA